MHDWLDSPFPVVLPICRGIRRSLTQADSFSILLHSGKIFLCALLCLALPCHNISGEWCSLAPRATSSSNVTLPSSPTRGSAFLQLPTSQQTMCPLCRSPAGSLACTRACLCMCVCVCVCVCVHQCGGILYPLLAPQQDLYTGHAPILQPCRPDAYAPSALCGGALRQTCCCRSHPYRTYRANE